DVLAGEVWLAAGQSNMEMTLATCADVAREIAGAHCPRIRYFKVPHAAARAPRDRTEGSWVAVSPESAGDMTAVGYYFARELERELGVPVGIIDASWGGTRVEAWT